MTPAELHRQMRLMMIVLDELLPGVICASTRCPDAAQAGIPHMANDLGPHPEPAGYRRTVSHEWRRRPWWRRERGQHR